MENGSLDLVSVKLLHAIFRGPHKENVAVRRCISKSVDKLILDKKLRHLHLSLISGQMGLVA